MNNIRVKVTSLNNWRPESSEMSCDTVNLCKYHFPSFKFVTDSRLTQARQKYQDFIDLLLRILLLNFILRIQ